MFPMETAAKLSGATLGYIVGNTRGGIIGYKLAKKLTENYKTMPPVPRKRKRSVSGPPMVPVKRRRVVVRRGAPRVLQVNPQAPKVRGAPKRPKRKSVKITSSFKRKVQKVLDSYKIKGNYMEINYQLKRITATDDNIQVVEELGDNFTFPQILDAASVLWNEKAPTTDKNPTNPANFPVESAKIYVEDAYTVYTFKNNTRRQYTMKIFNCKSKNIALSVTALGAWTATALAEANPDGSNVVSVSPNTLYSDPRYFPNWNAIWSTDVTTVQLEPGQTYVYRLQGPMKRLYDFPKYHQAGYVATGQRDFRNVFFTAYPDLVSTSLSGCGRLVDNESSGDFVTGIVVESKRVYKLCMPEQVGYLTAPASGTQKLDLRKYAHAIWNFGPTQVGFVTRVDDENPVVLEQGL